MNKYYDELETRSTAQREQELLGAISAQLLHAKENSPAYSASLHDYDGEPLSALEQLQDFPITRKSALIERQRAQPPLGGLGAFTPEQLAYIFVSPGPIYEASTKRADYWRFARCLFAAGFRAGDLVQNCFSYHFTPAGAMGDSGCSALGCGVIPAGVGQTDLQAQTINDLRPSGYIGTPSFLKIILDRADELDLDVTSLRKALVSGEALPASTRDALIARGISVRQCYATADLGVIAYESAVDSGLIIDEGVHVEIVRPGTGDLVADGKVGEVVVTSLNPDYPLIRFATGDLSAMLDGTSACGRTNRRIAGWMGRADQSVKVRGMFIHPEQIAGIIKRHPEITRARLVVDWVKGQDQMTLCCEVGQPSTSLGEAITQSIRDLCKVRGEVHFVSLDSIANDGLVIEDARQHQ